MYRKHKCNVNEGCWGRSSIHGCAGVCDLLFLFSMRAVHEESNLEKCVFALESKHKCVADSFWGDTYHWHFWHQIAREQFHYISDKSRSKYSERFHISFPATPTSPIPWSNKGERNLGCCICAFIVIDSSVSDFHNSIKLVPKFFLKKKGKQNKNTE